MTKPKRQYKRYSSEFKREALVRASEEGMTDKAVCDELGNTDAFLRAPSSRFHARGRRRDRAASAECPRKKVMFSTCSTHF